MVTIEKLAKAVARHGLAFEQKVRDKQRENLLFSFLMDAESEDYAYYAHCVAKAESTDVASDGARERDAWWRQRRAPQGAERGPEPPQPAPDRRSSISSSSVRDRVMALMSARGLGRGLPPLHQRPWGERPEDAGLPAPSLEDVEFEARHALATMPPRHNWEHERCGDGEEAGGLSAVLARSRTFANPFSLGALVTGAGIDPYASSRCDPRGPFRWRYWDNSADGCGEEGGEGKEGAVSAESRCEDNDGADGDDERWGYDTLRDDQNRRWADERVAKGAAHANKQRAAAAAVTGSSSSHEADALRCYEQVQSTPYASLCTSLYAVQLSSNLPHPRMAAGPGASARPHRRACGPRRSPG